MYFGFDILKKPAVGSVFYMSLKYWIFLQEILDQIVDVDLVVNFKCNEEHLIKKNLESEACAPRQEFLSMGNAGFSSADAASAWKEKFRIYSEQVEDAKVSLFL